mmetsp:Transcript_15672/g.28509  ORF Transcript_15672/g.28509 Transcript_15672/m.28509 type:complete len:659 (+) Transcript_15672:29-2005(+)
MLASWNMASQDQEELKQDPSASSQPGGAVKGLSFSFDPAPAEGEFSPLYTATPACHQASTNAGDLDLYVGGGAINWAFGELFKREQGLRFGKYSQPYTALHKSLLAASRASGGSVASATAIDELVAVLPQLSLCAAFGWAGEDLDGDKKGHEGATGSVFLDIFAAHARPFRQEYNVAMLYVVGPVGLGCTRKGIRPALDRDDFLQCVERLGRRSVQAVQTYNNLRLDPQNAGLPPIEEVRWCLVSGGVYKHPDVTKLEVAAATLQGMLHATSADLRVKFSYDEDVFRLARLGQVDALHWKEYLKMGSIGTQKCLDSVQQFAQSIPEWVATEKVHGANFCFMTDGVEVGWAKRTSKLTAADKFYSVQEQMPRYHPFVLKAFQLLSTSMTNLTTLSIYGEYFGGWYPGCNSHGLARVQIGIAYAPDHNFIPFDVWAGTQKEGRYLNFDEQVAVLREAGFPLVMEPVVRGSFAEVANIEVEGLHTTIPRRLGLPAITENQQAEGVVIRPTVEPTGVRTGNAPRLMLKKKAQAFWEVTNQRAQAEGQAAKVAKLSEGPADAQGLSEVPEVALPVVEAAKRYITMNRLSAVVSKEGPALLEPDMSAKLIGLFVKDICEDLFQDHEAATSSLEAPALKALKKAVHVQATLFLADNAAQLRAELQ